MFTAHTLLLSELAAHGVGPNSSSLRATSVCINCVTSVSRHPHCVHDTTSGHLLFGCQTWRAASRRSTKSQIYQHSEFRWRFDYCISNKFIELLIPRLFDQTQHFERCCQSATQKIGRQWKRWQRKYDKENWKKSVYICFEWYVVRDLILKAHSKQFQRCSCVASHANAIFKHIFHRLPVFKVHCFALWLIARPLGTDNAGLPFIIFSERSVQFDLRFARWMAISASDCNTATTKISIRATWAYCGWFDFTESWMPYATIVHFPSFDFPIESIVCVHKYLCGLWTTIGDRHRRRRSQNAIRIKPHFRKIIINKCASFRG